MNNWRLLLFAVFCIFQPISSENLFNGRGRCLQRPDIYRKYSRYLDHSTARSEIRRGVRNGREFSERVNDYGLRFSERNLNRDESVRSEDRRSRSDDRIRVSFVSRERFASNQDRSIRSSGDERSEPEVRNVREARLDAEREIRNLRLTRSLSGDRRDDREETRESRNSRYTALNRRFIERYFDDSQDRFTRSRQGRDANERRESRNLRDQEQVRDFLRRGDPSRRNSERLLREYQENDDNRRQVVRSQFIRDLNEISRRSAPATSRRVNEQRDLVQRRESDESSAFRREFRHSYDKASERTIRLDDSRRQINERLTRAQNNVPTTRRNDVRSKLSREEFSRRSSPTTANRAFERRETDESRQNRRELRASSDRANDRESVQRRESGQSRDFRRELRDGNDKATGRTISWVDSLRRTNERLDVAQRRTKIDDAVRRNEIREHRQFRRETRDSDRAYLRFASQSMRYVHRDARQNSRMDLSRNSIDAISRRTSPVSIRDVDERVEYLRGRDSTRTFRRETGAQRNDERYNARVSNNDRRTSAQNIAERKESVERSDDTRHSRRGSRSESDIRFVRFGNPAERINERESNRRERQKMRTESARNVDERASMRRHNNLDERNLRREIRSIRLDDSSRRDNERFARVQREQTRIIRDVDIRALNVEFRHDNRRVDENRRTTRMTRDSKATKEDEALRYVRDNERTRERSIERTLSMPIRTIQRDDTSRRTTNDLNGLRNTIDQRSSQNRISKERISEDANSQRRFIRESRYESRSTKTSERNMERDNGKRLDSNDNRQERDSRRSVLRDNRSSENVRDNKNREEIRVSMGYDAADSFSLKWQHLLYLLQAAYIIGILAKLPQTKENFEKKTRIGIWNPPKLIKVD